jgi:peptidoglycan/LPS O-acetylase OafA/YrhL
MPVAKYGFLGVPAFFVISGFVIAYSAERRTAVGFVIARFSRLYSTFDFCMTLTFLAILMWGPPHFKATPAQWFANLFIHGGGAWSALHGCGLPAQRWTREFLTGRAVRFGCSSRPHAPVRS